MGAQGFVLTTLFALPLWAMVPEERPRFDGDSPNANPVRRIVVADDTADFRFLVTLALRADPRFEVVGEAENGLEAVEAARAQRPDVVLLDVSMPVMDGLQALPLLADCCPETRVVVLSGFATDTLESKALSLGAVAYVEKGTEMSRLIEVVWQAAS
jgi:DNA-binding NarL/FixJ family response regulator